MTLYTGYLSFLTDFEGTVGTWEQASSHAGSSVPFKNTKVGTGNTQLLVKGNPILLFEKICSHSKTLGTSSKPETIIPERLFPCSPIPTKKTRGVCTEGVTLICVDRALISCLTQSKFSNPVSGTQTTVSRIY